MLIARRGKQLWTLSAKYSYLLFLHTWMQRQKVCEPGFSYFQHWLSVSSTCMWTRCAMKMSHRFCERLKVISWLEHSQTIATPSPYVFTYNLPNGHCKLCQHQTCGPTKVYDTVSHAVACNDHKRQQNCAVCRSLYTPDSVVSSKKN